jgi:predicted ATPase
MIPSADAMSEMTFEEQIEAVRRAHNLPEFTLETMDLWRLFEHHDDVRDVLGHFFSSDLSVSVPQIPVKGASNARAL